MGGAARVEDDEEEEDEAGVPGRSDSEKRLKQSGLYLKESISSLKLSNLRLMLISKCFVPTPVTTVRTALAVVV
eukprot:jgi/Chlat1/3226/Chrsp22S03505